MNMTDDPPGREIPRKRAVTLRSLLEITTVGKLGKGQTRTLNVLTAIKRDIRRPTVGQKEGERRDKGPNQS